MGHSGSKNPKINKNHDKQKMLKIGISVGRNDLTLEGHFQLGYHGKTIKNLRMKPLNSIRSKIQLSERRSHRTNATSYLIF